METLTQNLTHTENMMTLIADFNRAERKTATHRAAMVQAVTAILERHLDQGSEGIRHDVVADELRAEYDLILFSETTGFVPEWAKTSFTLEQSYGTMWWHMADTPLWY